MRASRCAAVVPGQGRERLSLPIGFVSNLRHSLLIASVRYPWRYKKVLRTCVTWHSIKYSDYRIVTSCPKFRCKMLDSLFLFLLAPFNALRPLKSSTPHQLGLEVVSTSTDQLTVQLPNSPTIEDEAQEIAPESSCMIKQLYQFPNFTTRLENLAVRPNGQLLIDCVTQPHIYGFDPSNATATPTILYTFKNVTSVLGIDEITKDVFAVVVGNFSSPGYHEPGSFSLWSIDLNRAKPIVKLITALPEAIALNGLATLKANEARDKPMVLIADSVDGVIWRVDPRTRAYTRIYDSPLLANVTLTGMGVNGIRTFGKKLYFINSGQETYGRIPLHHDASAAGEVELLARQKVGAWDDFDIDWEGNAWIATHRGDLTEVTVEGRARNMTGCNALRMFDPTSARFGRGSRKEENTLYIVTAGTAPTPPKDGHPGDPGGFPQIIAANVCQM